MAEASGKIVWVGRAISGLVALALLMSAFMKLKGGDELVQGMAHVRMDELDAADRSFSRAAEFVETERYARQWLDYVANERNIRDAAAGDD